MLDSYKKDENLTEFDLNIEKNRNFHAIREVIVNVIHEQNLTDIAFIDTNGIN